MVADSLIASAVYYTVFVLLVSYNIIILNYKVSEHILSFTIRLRRHEAQHFNSCCNTWAGPRNVSQVVV